MWESDKALSNVGGYEVHAGKLRRNGVSILTRATVKDVAQNAKVEQAISVRLDDERKTH
jgi:hypothetical protein